MSKKAEDRYHHGNLEAALASVARELLEESGPEALTLRAIASRAGVSQPALYRHYRNKDDLIAAVVDAGYLGLANAVAAAIGQGGDARSRLRAAGVAYVGYAAANPHWFRLWASRAQAEGRRTREGAQAAGAILATPVHQALAELVPPDEPRHQDLFRVLWALSHGLAGLVVERVFQLVDTEEERLEAASDAIAAMVELLPGAVEVGAASPTGRGDGTL